MNHTIKYLTITVIYDNSSNPIEQFIRYIGLFDEYYIKSTDTVIIETDTETFELDLNLVSTQYNDQNIIFDIDYNKYIINSICKNTPNKNLNLKYNGENTARYALAYDYTILDIDELKIIIKKLLLKNYY